MDTEDTEVTADIEDAKGTRDTGYMIHILQTFGSC